MSSAPERAPRGAVTEPTGRGRPGVDPGGEPGVEPVPAAPRVVGPGRVERGYRRQLEELGAELAGARAAAGAAARELELARLVERGAQRRLDREERARSRSRQELADARALERRLCAALGALQRENQQLAARVAELEAPARAALPERERPARGRGALLSALFGRRR